MGCGREATNIDANSSKRDGLWSRRDQPPQHLGQFDTNFFHTS